MSLASSKPNIKGISVYTKFLNILREARIVLRPNQRAMPPTIGPEFVSPSIIGPLSPSGVPFSRSSTGSSRTLPDNASSSSPPASSLSIPISDGDVDIVRVEGLRHAAVRLEARRYTTSLFAEQLLGILRSIHTPSWSDPDIVSDKVSVQKVSGSLTNAVFFVSCPLVPAARTVLLRVYGPSSGNLISRPHELHTLHVLSSEYHIGPRVYGTFENGRVEEYFDSTALTANDLRDPEISTWIGARMAELHGVDIDAVTYDAQPPDGPERGGQAGVHKNVKLWLPSAREVLALSGVSEASRKDLDLDRFEREWQLYAHWLHQKEKNSGASQRVFAHNDTQYGNLLRLRTLKGNLPPHRQIIVVDFEYAAPNPAAFDVANHFHEWTANYHGSTPHILDPSRYPSAAERRNFYRAYLTHTNSHVDAPASAPVAELAPDDTLVLEMDRLEEHVRAWAPASHGMWSIWGIVQAREFVEGKDGEPEFDYLGYAQCRMDGFRRELRALGIPGLEQLP